MGCPFYISLHHDPESWCSAQRIRNIYNCRWQSYLNFAHPMVFPLPSRSGTNCLSVHTDLAVTIYFPVRNRARPTVYSPPTRTVTNCLSVHTDLAAAAVIVVVVAAVAAVVAAAIAEQEDQDDDPPPVVAAEAVAQIVIVTHNDSLHNFS